MGYLCLVKNALANRFGDHRVHELPVSEGQIPLLILDLELATPVNVLVTNGLREKRMNVPERETGKEHIELFFCLPSYWEWDDLNNPNTNWVYEVIQRLSAYLLENDDAWFGNGHTMNARKDGSSLSSTMKQDHLILLNPLLLEEAMAPIQVGDMEVNFLSIVPIFSDEWDYKQSKGTVKFVRKLINKGVSEKLDDFRTSVLRSKWRIW